MTTLPVSTTDTRRGPVTPELAAGARAMLPWLLGVVPFGLVIGISAAHAAVPILAGWLTGPLIFAGSAQLGTIQLLDGGAAPLVVIVAALAVNLRFVLYSATMARHWRDRDRRWQGLAAYFLVDPTFAVGVDAYERAASSHHGHLRYLGGAATLWVAWIGAISAGAFLGRGLPAGLGLAWVIPLYLVAQLVPRLSNRATVVAVTAAAAAAVVGHWAPLHLGPMVAIVAGIAAGLLTEEEDR
jgi:predicted branched-subunit amino acid permease